jgi:hypothetical protein
MPATTTTRLQEKIKAFGRILRSWGYDDTDFVVESDTTSPLGELFGIAGGVLVVKRRSTGEVRVYQAGPESQWFDSVLHDLANGHLADAPVIEPRLASIDSPLGSGRDAVR